MKLITLLLATAISIAAGAQKTATISDPGAKERTLSASFTAIEVSDGIELYLSEGKEASLAVSYSDEKYAERFKTEVEEGVLKIYFDTKGIKWSNNKKRSLKAYVSFTTLQKLTASAGATVQVSVPITVSSLDMKFTSGARFEGNIKANQLTIDQNSGAMVSLSGTTEKCAIEVSSGAMFKGYEFVAGYCDAKATSGGAIRISIQKELNAKANSGGAIHYKGAGVIKDVNVNSGGIVKKA